MQSVTRFTTKYVAGQDRMCLSLEDENGAIRNIWLTQRLLVRLLPRLLAPLEKTADNSTPPHVVARQVAEQSFSQQAAVQAMQQQTPVSEASKSQAQYPPFLAWGADIKMENNILFVHFKSEDGSLTQALRFTVPALRQWLSVVHSQFTVAEWTASFWPRWINSKNKDSSPSRKLS